MLWSMAQNVVSMEAKLLAVFSSGVPVKVTALCRELGISRQTLYKYRRRFEAERPSGVGGAIPPPPLVSAADLRADRGFNYPAAQGVTCRLRRPGHRLSSRAPR